MNCFQQLRRRRGGAAVVCNFQHIGLALFSGELTLTFPLGVTFGQQGCARKSKAYNERVVIAHIFYLLASRGWR